MEKYIKNLFNIFKRTKGYDVELKIKDSSQLLSQFKQWIFENEEKALHYSVFLRDKVLTKEECDGVIELDKGIFDSVLGGLEKVGIDTIGSASVYSYTFDKFGIKDKDLRTYTGVCLNKGQNHTNSDIFDLIKTEDVNDIKVPTIITQIPSRLVVSDKLARLAFDHKKTVIVGSYGSVSDKDWNKNSVLLHCISNDMTSNGLQVNEYCSSDDKYYQCAIKIFSKSRKQLGG